MWSAPILFFIVLVAGVLIVSHYNKKSDINLFDLVTRNGTLSTTKILQLVGGAVGTWVVIKMTAQAHMTWDIFAIYLTYVASVDGFSKVVAAKFGHKE